jgi:hypothetical protein
MPDRIRDKVMIYTIHINTTYDNNNPLLRICEKCSSNQTEDELHFIINCPLYIDNREIMFNNICELCPKFKDLPNEANFIWL